MYDSRQLQGVLQDARELVHADWGTTNDDVEWDCANGAHCAAIAIIHASEDNGEDIAPFVAFLGGAGVAVPDDELAAIEAVYAFNDAQADRGPVLAAFDRAIGALDVEPTPKADGALAVMSACAEAGAVVARQIVAAHPHMDVAEITALTSAELFYAAQDTAQACSLGVKVDRA